MANEANSTVDMSGYNPDWHNYLHLSLRFNGHFPGKPGLARFIEAKDNGGGDDNWTTGAVSRAKLQSNHHHQQTNIQFITGRMPFRSPNQQCQKHWRENNYLQLLIRNQSLAFKSAVPSFLKMSTWLYILHSLPITQAHH